MNEYLKRVTNEAAHVEDKMTEIEMDMQDDQDNWDVEMENINKKILEQAVKNGISKEDYYKNYNFKLMKITDLKAKYQEAVADRCANCQAARAGKCEKHLYHDYDKKPDKTKPKVNKLSVDPAMRLNIDKAEAVNAGAATLGGLKRTN